MNLEAETMRDPPRQDGPNTYSSYRPRLVGELWRLGNYLGV